MKKITTIIFDFGRVIHQEPGFAGLARFYAKKKNLDEKQVLDLWLKHWMLARVNPKKDKNLWIEVGKTVGKSPEQLRKELIKAVVIRPGVIKFAKDLKKKYTVALFSNHICGWLEPLIKKYKFCAIFDPLFTSYNLGYAKPDIRSYQAILKKLKVPATECVFIDDQENNLKPAKKLGMTVILYKNQKHLKSELKKLKII